MTEIKFGQMIIAITLVWVIIRSLANIKNIKKKNVSWKREAQLLLVYVCIVVISRIVNFPMHHVDGHIGTMKFDAARAIPPRVNLIPFVHMIDVYDGWLVNIIGNVAMFIPVGIVWPVCFKKLDSIAKTILAGAGFSLFIEITQLPFFERCSDIDDLLLNTLGAAIGAVIYFVCRELRDMKNK